MSWWFSSKKPKYPGKYAVVPAVIQFCLSSELFKELDTMMAADSGVLGEQEEFQLASTEKHAQFVANFESRLEAFIISKKCTVAEFYEMCQKATDIGDENIEAFITLLTQMLEFTTWTDMVRDPAKRKYVQGILAHYAKVLSE